MLLVFLLGAGAAWPAGASAALAKYVVLVDWDGFEPALLNRGYSLPNLQSLANRGSRSTAANSTFQTFSNPARASLSTGAYPERHGNVAHVFDPSTNVVLGQTRNMAVETIAEALRRSSSGKTMASVQWYMVQDRGISCGDPNYLYVQPGGQFGDRVNVAIEILKRRPVNSCGKTVTVPKIPNFLAVYGPQPDELTHDEGTSGPNIKATMEQQDRDLGRLIQATKNVGTYKNTAFILTSDHGMTDWDKTALPVLSQAVSEAGYTSEVVFPGSSPQTAADVIISPAVRIAHFHFRGAAASDPDAGQKIRSRLQARPEIENVLGPSELAVLRASPKLGDLVAEARPPWSVAMNQPASVKASHGAQAELDMPLYMAGAGISRTPPINPGVVDVAPTISALLAIPCPAQAQGRPLRESFTSSASCPSSSGTTSVKSADVVVAESTFDEGREGWKVKGDSTVEEPEVKKRGGNPTGYVRATDPASGEIGYWRAPKQFLGNRQDSYGSTLTFDLRESKARRRGKGRGKDRNRSDTTEQNQQLPAQDDEDGAVDEEPPAEGGGTEEPANASQVQPEEPPPEEEQPNGEPEEPEGEQPAEEPDPNSSGEEEPDEDPSDQPTPPTVPEPRDVSGCGDDPGPQGDHEPDDKNGEKDTDGRKERDDDVADEPTDLDERDVILCGDGLELTYDLELEPSKRLFSYYQVRLTEQGWTNRATGDPATSGEMKNALGSLDALLIRAEYRARAETDDLDNVTLRRRP